MSYLVPGGSDLVEHGDAAKSLVSAIKGESSARGVSIASLTPAYRLELVHRILSMTSHDAYVHITDFEWYFSVLVDLAYVAEVPVGIEIRNSMLDVAARVEELRSYAVDLCRKLLRDGGFVEPPKSDSRCPEVIYAAAWICGEYSK
jgi:AP-3 complex subunit delta-1